MLKKIKLEISDQLRFKNKALVEKIERGEKIVIHHNNYLPYWSPTGKQKDSLIFHLINNYYYEEYHEIVFYDITSYVVYPIKKVDCDIRNLPYHYRIKIHKMVEEFFGGESITISDQNDAAYCSATGLGDNFASWLMNNFHYRNLSDGFVAYPSNCVAFNLQDKHEKFKKTDGYYFYHL